MFQKSLRDYITVSKFTIDQHNDDYDFCHNEGALHATEDLV